MVATPNKNSVDSTQDKPEVLEPFDTLPPSTIEDECHVSNSAADGCGDEEPPQPSRDERLEKHRMQCQNLITYLTTNVCPSGLTKKEVRNIKNQAKTHQWDIKRKELIYVGAKKNLRKKVVMDVEEISEILHQYHSNPMGGHSGINNTLAKVSQYYIWNGIKEDVVEYCKTCDRCQRYEKLKTQAPELKSIKVNKALELVGMDLIGPLPTTDAGYKYVLTFTDYYTKFVDFYPLKEKAAAGIACCIKTFVCRWGAPCRLLSDQGREFVAKVNTEVCRQFGITRSVTSAYHPQTNGLDERTNQTLKVRLAKLVNEHQNNWDDFLEEVAFSIRTQKQGSTKFSPFFLMFGRHPRTPIEMENVAEEDGIFELETPSSEILEEMTYDRSEMMNCVDQQVQANIEKAQAKQKKDFAKRKNKGVKVFQLSVGDLVLRKVMKNISRKGGKLDALWTGPYRIVEIDHHQRVSLAKLNGDVLNVKVPYEQIKPHTASDLHKPKSSPAVPLEPGFEEIKAEEVEEEPCQSTSQTDTVTSEQVPKASKNETNDVVCCGEKKRKKRPIGPLPVTPALKYKDFPKLLPVIESGEWLTDEHIDNAQAILAENFPHIGGLQATWVFISEECQSVGTPKEDFVQIVNVCGNHWITLSNIGCPKDTVTLYDSLYNNLDSASKAKLHKQIAYMLMPTSKHLTIQWADMQKQTGTCDCGLFAIAAATSLCYGILPQDCYWEQESMRDHLCMCFQQGDLALFPQLAVVRKHKRHHRVETTEVFCHCRQPYNPGVFMVACDRCQDWFHRGCERVPKRINKNTLFVCKNCK